MPWRQQDGGPFKKPPPDTLLSPFSLRRPYHSSAGYPRFHHPHSPRKKSGDQSSSVLWCLVRHLRLRGLGSVLFSTQSPNISSCLVITSLPRHVLKPAKEDAGSPPERPRFHHPHPPNPLTSITSLPRLILNLAKKTGPLQNPHPARGRGPDATRPQTRQE